MEGSPRPDDASSSDAGSSDASSQPEALTTTAIDLSRLRLSVPPLDSDGDAADKGAGNTSGADQADPREVGPEGMGTEGMGTEGMGTEETEPDGTEPGPRRDRPAPTDEPRVAGDPMAELHRARCALSAVGEAVLVLDPAGKVEQLNPAAWKLLDRPRGEILGQPIFELAHLLDADEEPVDLLPCLSRGDRLELGPSTVLERTTEERLEVEGSIVPILATGPSDQGDPIPQIAGAVVVLRDVSDRHRLTQSLTRAARFDTLTGLLNREGFEQHLGDALERAEASANQARQENSAEPDPSDLGEEPTASSDTLDVLYHMDLDQFQVVNDTCGHAAGDMLVQWIASLVRERLRNADVLARLGGDEFGLLVRDTTLEGAEALAAEIHTALSHFRFVWQDKSFRIGTSMGMVPISADFDDAADLSGAANQACFLAKRQGRGRTQVYEPDADEVRRHQGQMHWVVRLRQALDESLFELYWQRIAPIRPLVADGPLFFEVLVRLRGRDGSLHLPGEFLPAAERFDLMPALDCWVVAHTLELLEGQSQEFLDALDGVTLNLSGASIGDGRVLDWIHEHLDKTRFPSQKLCFEITETAAVSNLSRAVEMIEQLRRRRCRWALDDFGSGMSSFRYLQELPVDFVKIDGEIVADLPHNRLSRAVVEAIHQVAHVMHARTIAEKVESAELLAALRDVGLDLAQGFHIARPRPIRTQEVITDHIASPYGPDAAFPSSSSETSRSEPPSNSE